MKCPVGPSVNLVMSDRQGVEIDYCPECRGVWLDRRELDKIIERSASRETVSTPPPPQFSNQPGYPVRNTGAFFARSNLRCVGDFHHNLDNSWQQAAQNLNNIGMTPGKTVLSSTYLYPVDSGL